MAPKKYDINTEDQLYGPAKVGDTVNPDLMKSPKTTFGQQMQSSKAVTDAIRGAFTEPEPTAPSTQSITGSGGKAGEAPAPTMFGYAHTSTALDPRYVLSEGNVLGSIANLYQVTFSGFPPMWGGSNNRSKDSNFIERDLGLLCSEASLPATSFGTLEVNGHYQGRNEVFAHTRIYPSLSLTFYETLQHKTLMFFEEWQRWITEDERTGVAESSDLYYYRMRFPSEYKCDSIFITKFEKDYGGMGYSNTIQYQFLKAFPKNVTSVPVSYGQSEFLKVTVEIAYDRYIVNKQAQKAETKPGYNPESPTQELVREEVREEVREDLAIQAITKPPEVETVQPTSSTIPTPRTPKSELDLSGWPGTKTNPSEPIITQEQRRAQRVERLGENRVREIEAKAAAARRAGAE